MSASDRWALNCGSGNRALGIVSPLPMTTLVNGLSCIAPAADGSLLATDEGELCINIRPVAISCLVDADRAVAGSVNNH